MEELDLIFRGDNCAKIASGNHIMYCNDMYNFLGEVKRLMAERRSFHVSYIIHDEEINNNTSKHRR